MMLFPLAVVALAAGWGDADKIRAPLESFVTARGAVLEVWTDHQDSVAGVAQGLGFQVGKRTARLVFLSFPAEVPDRKQGKVPLTPKELQFRLLKLADDCCVEGIRPLDQSILPKEGINGQDQGTARPNPRSDPPVSGREPAP